MFYKIIGDYICEECGYRFTVPKTYTDDCTPYGGPPEPSFQRTYTGCPNCGGNYIEYEEDEGVEEDEEQ